MTKPTLNEIGLLGEALHILITGTGVGPELKVDLAGRILRRANAVHQALLLDPHGDSDSPAKPMCSAAEREETAYRADPAVLSDLLSLVLHPSPSVETIAEWTTAERFDVEGWASDKHRIDRGLSGGVRRPAPAVLSDWV